ncbi:ammonium transporter 3 member 1-like [Syzygium oleosum]|uniref:ammonium transporter 3 member 1-like n=1 Tax=Syzygium oleosum TaxID=219896 RepID=UPI0024BB21D6|nr:ammonium transporter 3 member 1-like [Syzygium oleosum]
MAAAAPPPNPVPVAYQAFTSAAVPDWLNKGDNAWQMVSATLVGLQSVPGLVILYGSIVKKKWAVNSAFMALYAFAAVVLCWVIWAYKMSFGDKLLPFWGKAGPALGQSFLIKQAVLPETKHFYKNHTTVETDTARPFYPMASMVWFQCVFAAITLILLAGSVLGRMNFRAWMMFVPLWLTFSYTVGAFSLWGGGFLFHWGVMDYSGGYVIHLSSGIAGLTTAYWVGPRLTKDRERFPPNNVLLMLAGAGLLWMGWAGFNGGDPYTANIDSSVAVLNTNICAATSLLVWTWLDVIFFKKPSVIGAVQGMITGLVCITPAAGLVQGWAAIIMGIMSGSVPWFTMMIVHKRWTLLQKIDDTLGVFHTHAVAGYLGGILTGLFAEPELCSLFLPVTNSRGGVYGGSGGVQILKQMVGGAFIIGWNAVVTSVVCVAISWVVPLRMPEEQLLIGDDAVHGEEAYALWGDGEKYDSTQHGMLSDETTHPKASSGATQVV